MVANSIMTPVSDHLTPALPADSTGSVQVEFSECLFYVIISRELITECLFYNFIVKQTQVFVLGRECNKIDISIAISFYLQSQKLFT